ncbi:hypothetical protein CLO_0367 [Clostridium botulinum E1 str. 'BoNT E Beluga']|nr:hypothetical protein CLO_0367 [Clostridium botulinum E1 str. 'BoNT E Beluga']
MNNHFVQDIYYLVSIYNMKKIVWIHLQMRKLKYIIISLNLFLGGKNYAK